MRTAMLLTLLLVAGCPGTVPTLPDELSPTAQNLVNVAGWYCVAAINDAGDEIDIEIILTAAGCGALLPHVTEPMPPNFPSNAALLWAAAFNAACGGQTNAELNAAGIALAVSCLATTRDGRQFGGTVTIGD